MQACFCERCEFARLMGVSPDDEFGVRLGGRVVAAYMRRYNASYPEAVEAIDRLFRMAMAEMIETYGRIHGLDQDDTWVQVLAHGVNPPRFLQ